MTWEASAQSATSSQKREEFTTRIPDQNLQLVSCKIVPLTSFFFISSVPKSKKVEEVKQDVTLAVMASQIVGGLQKDFHLVPRKSGNSRYRVEVVGEQAEQFKDSGLTFSSAENAEKWCKDFVPVNMSWRIIFETMDVVKFKEYRPPYLG